NNLTPDALKFEALALSKIEVVGGLAMSLLNYGDLKASNLLKEGESENSFSANKLKAVVGWDIGAVLTESEPEIVKVSLRTRDASKYDLSKIAEALGGGGHKAAAGALIRLPLAEAKQKLIEAVRSLYPELLKLS
ncbi:MAG: DHHA1 domain-containing protein, partial [Patescibacteria group bacterium]